MQWDEMQWDEASVSGYEAYCMMPTIHVGA